MLWRKIDTDLRMKMSKKQVKADYYSSEKIVSEYDHKRFLRGGGVYVAEKETEMMQYFLGKHCSSDSIVLDCPVGTGRFIPLIGQFTKHIIAVDISDAMLENASRYQAERFIKSSADNMPLEENSVDFWVSSRFFFHFEDLDGFFQEASRVIKSKGGFAFDVFNWSPRSLLPEFILGGQTYNHKLDYIQQLCDKYRFSIVEVRRAFFIPTYIASFIPNSLVSSIENWTDEVLPNYKTKSYFFLIKD